MPPQVLEGTWEEIAVHASELMGKRLKVVVEPEAPVALPNYIALNAMQEADRIQLGMNPKPGSNGVAILREGRRGDMYGDSSSEVNKNPSSMALLPNFQAMH